MKIINLIQKPQLRGAEIFACQLSNHLLELGHGVIVVSIFKGDSQLPFKGKTINLDRPLSKRFYDLKGWKKFREILKDFNHDIVQANAADTLKFAVSSKVIFSWDYNLIYRNANKMGDFISSKFKWYLNNFYLTKVDYVISVSKECEKDFIKTFSYNPNKIVTVEIGVENQKLGQVPLDLVPIFKKGPTLVHIGGFVPEKNHNGLIDIFNEISKTTPEIQLLLLGKGKLEQNIKEKVEQLGHTKNVHFLGYRTDVMDILHNADAFILPSLIEGLPAVILEAMFCETAVIAYNVGGIGEVVVSNSTGWLVNKNDEDSMISDINEVLNNKPEVKASVTRAKEMILEKFLNRKIAERFLELYKKCEL